MKLHSKCGHLKKPMDVVRYLEDELSKVESKLINFPELKLSEADMVSLILQAISADARQYVVWFFNCISARPREGSRSTPFPERLWVPWLQNIRQA